jgi:hypothetical protein
MCDPITGRPVGRNEPFAATWSVDAIVAENGVVVLGRSADIFENPLGSRLTRRSIEEDTCLLSPHAATGARCAQYRRGTYISSGTGWRKYSGLRTRSGNSTGGCGTSWYGN